MSSADRCEQCGGAVEMRTGVGRTSEYRPGLRLPVPVDFPIATCVACEERYLSVEEAQRLREVQRPAFVEWQKTHVGKLVHAIKAAHSVPLREIERVCGVTQTYFSHVLKGRNEVGQPTINLLEALALYPAEFRRRQLGGSWDAAYLSVLRHGSSAFRSQGLPRESSSRDRASRSWSTPLTGLVRSSPKYDVPIPTGAGTEAQVA